MKDEFGFFLQPDSKMQSSLFVLIKNSFILREKLIEKLEESGWKDQVELIKGYNRCMENIDSTAEWFQPRQLDVKICFQYFCLNFIC